jgi:hypothetical protein
MFANVWHAVAKKEVGRVLRLQVFEESLPRWILPEVLEPTCACMEHEHAHMNRKLKVFTAKIANESGKQKGAEEMRIRRVKTCSR